MRHPLRTFARLATLSLASLLLATTMARAGEETWESRLRAELDGVEAATKELDGVKADRTLPLEKRIEKLHERLAALEKAREMPTAPVDVETEGAASRLQILSQAVVRLGARLRAIKRHDRPPAVTPSKPAPPPAPEEGTPAEKDEPEDEDEVVWPEELRAKATASVDYTSTGTWAYRVPYPTWYDRQEYRLDGYEGRLHLSLRLEGLVEQVKHADVVLFVVGNTGPFRFQTPPRYVVEWPARHRHMWNGALKTFGNYDTWYQDVRPRWGGRVRKRVLRPRVEAWVSRVVTQDGREITFLVPPDRKDEER